MRESMSPATISPDGILEISAWNQANALRQVTVQRGLDVRDFVLTTFGGSGSLLACRLIDILGLQAVLVPQNPGNVSAFGLLTVDVRNDYVQTWVRSEGDLERLVRRRAARLQHLHKTRHHPLRHPNLQSFTTRLKASLSN